MERIIILLFAAIFALGATEGTPRRTIRNESQHQPEKTLTDQERSIKITIASVGPSLGPPTRRYRFGEQVPITITLTNTSSQPISACVSSDLYQDRPSLTKDGKLLPIMKFQSSDMSTAVKDEACQQEDLPEPLSLKPNEPTMVDWMILVDDSKAPTGAVAWYDQLTPGVYELSIQRRFGCCDGPMAESNKISFEVVP